MTPARVRAQLASITSPTGTAGLHDEYVDWAYWSKLFALHPYLGYVFDDNFEREPRLDVGGPDAIDYGFSLAEKGVFHTPVERTLVTVITGGSVAFNVGRRFGDHISTVVQTGLSDEYDRVIVVNAAIPGFHQPQQLLLLNYLWTLGAHFDVVINLDGFNEIALAPEENLSTGVAGFFPYAWYFKVADAGPDTRLGFAELAQSERQRRRLAAFFQKNPWKYSNTASVLWSFLNGRLIDQMIEVEAELARQRSTDSPRLMVSGPRTEYRDRAEVLQHMAEIWWRASIQLHNASETVGARYYHFLQPNQYVPDSKPMTEDERSSTVNWELAVSPYVLEGYPLLFAYGRQLREEGIQFHDLSMLFESTTEPTYIDDCCHYTSKGDQMVAQAIGDAIVDDFRRNR